MISVADIKVFLNIPVLDTTKDAILTALELKAVAYITNYCNRNFASATYTEYKFGTDSDLMFIDNAPLNSLTSIEYYDNDKNLTSIAVSPDTLGGITLLRSNSILLFKGYKFSKDLYYKIVYTGGYSSYPKDLETACLYLVLKYYYDSPYGDKRIGLNSKSIGSTTPENISYKDLMSEVQKLLQPYKINNV